MINYKKLSEDTLSLVEKCELTGDSIVEYIDKSIPFNRCIHLQGFNADQLVREVCRRLKDKGYCKKTARLNIHISNIIANVLAYKNRQNAFYFYFPARKNAHYVPKPYNPIRITYSPFITSIRGLTKIDFLKRVQGFFERGRGKGKRSRAGATSKFIQLIQQFNVTFDDVYEEEMEIIQLKNSEKQFIVYQDTSYTKKIRNNLKKYNALLKKTKIVLSQTNQVKEYLNNLKNESPDFARKKYVRIFNNSSFKEGGRFYNPWWQQIKNKKIKLRKNITINGNQTVELDFNALHIHLLYHLEGLDYNKFYSSNHDPYTLEGFEEYRDMAKGVILVSLNMSKKITSLPYMMPKILKNEKYFVKKFKYTKLIQIFSAHHHPIAKYLCSGIGIQLQNMDSNLSDYVIKKMTNKKIPVLNIHDSFIVEKQYEENLKDTMTGCIRHFKIKSIPKITTK
jgi:hypothetical protein